MCPSGAWKTLFKGPACKRYRHLMVGKEYCKRKCWHTWPHVFLTAAVNHQSLDGTMLFVWTNMFTNGKWKQTNKTNACCLFNFTAADHFERHTPVPLNGNSQARVPMKAVTLFVWLVYQMMKSYWNNGSMTAAANHEFKLLWSLASRPQSWMHGSSKASHVHVTFVQILMQKRN